jgi:predicted MFS family arabinose efflux permease
MAGGIFGSFIGLSLGGAIAAQFGWRGAFAAMALLGLALAGAYALVVRDRRAAPDAAAQPIRALSVTFVARSLFGSPAVVLTYVASGLQLFVLGALTAWAPSYLNRSQGLAPGVAAAAAAGLLLSAGVGMVACGALSDRICARRPHLRPWLASAFALITFTALEAALVAPPGAVQIGLALIGLFCAGGTTGPAGAIVAAGTPLALHGAALAVLTLANNLLGLAPGPALTGLLADRLGLHAALQVAISAALLSAAVFGLCARFRQSDHQQGR